MQDPALLHVTLLFSAWQLATLHGNLPTPEVMYHKGESIRWLNKSLLKPNHIPTDLTIGVVACLTKFEVVFLKIIFPCSVADLWSEPSCEYKWHQTAYGWPGDSGEKQRWN